MNVPLSRSSLGGGGHADHEAAFKSAMRHLAAGVSVITAAMGDERNGMTTTSLVSLSAEPPSLLVNVKQDASSLSMIRSSGCFAANVLGHGHQAVADRFAGRGGVKGAARFAEADWIGAPGRPAVLADALASFECDVEDMIERFSHTIIIGRVTATRVSPDVADPALVYWRAAYSRIGTKP